MKITIAIARNTNFSFLKMKRIYF